MINILSTHAAFRGSALALAIIAAPSWAQENPEADDANTSWRENAEQRCAAQYSVEQCQDKEFLETNFHVESLSVAHRAAIQREQLAKKALRELTLQYVCNTSASDNCANDANPTQCAAQIEQSCAMLKTEAAICIQNAVNSCADSSDVSSCKTQRIAFCPSTKKQSIEQLLAKYPKLNAAQKSRLIAAAAELDAKTSGWWSNLVSWLKTPFF